VNRSPEALAPALLLVIRFYERRLRVLLAQERARAYLNRILDFKRLSTRAAGSQHPHICSTAKHRFDNHQSPINLRIESEFLTMLKSRNRLVLTLLEQHIFCRFTRTSATFTHFSAAVIR
jgi:hypothetical protein